MKYSGYEEFECRNGEGYGCTLYVSGCIHNCKGCFSPQTHDFNYGKEFDRELEESILNYYEEKQNLLQRFTLCGGDPLHPNNSKRLFSFIKEFKNKFPKIKIWAYTGYLYEDLLERNEELLKYIDILIDGKFVLELKNIKLQYRGSSNQRIIDVQKSLEQNNIVEVDYDTRSKRIYER